MSAGSVPLVRARIVEAAASRIIRPCAVPPPRLRGGFGQHQGSGACTFLGRDSPDYLPVPSNLQITCQLDGRIAIFPPYLVKSINPPV
jgi:hypothetical protein